MTEPGASGGWSDPGGQPLPPAGAAPLPGPYDAVPPPGALPPAGPYPGPWQPAYPPPGYGPPPILVGYLPQPRTNGLAVTSMILSLTGLVVTICGLCFWLFWLLGLPLSVTGAILGQVGLGQIRARGEQGAGMAITGIVLGWLSTALTALVIVATVFVFGAFGFAGVGLR